MKEIHPAMLKQILPRIFSIGLTVLFILLSFSGVLNFIGDEFFPLTQFWQGGLLAIVLAVALYFIKNKLEKLNVKTVCIALSILCFLFKLFWVLKVRIAPEMDYLTYYEYAVKLSKSFYAPSEYVALFPHIFGYSFFLSIFIKIFGESFLVAPLLNVCLSVVSGVLIFLICHRLFNLKAGFFGYILWIFCPSQTMYNSLVIADLLYTTLILLFIFILTGLKQTDSLKKIIICGGLSGVILSFANACRPVAVILIIAYFIWILVLRFPKLTEVSFRKTFLGFGIALIAFYFILGQAFNFYMAKRLGEQPASSPGYNIYVGFNENSKGMWNYEDSAFLTHLVDEPDGTPKKAQEKMLEAAKERIFSGNIDFLELFKEKLKIFIGDDGGVVFYLKPVLNHYQLFTDLSNIFYYMLLFLLLFGTINSLRKKDLATTAVILLYVTGLILAQMLAEVAPRYHYSLIPMFIIASQYIWIGKKKRL